MPTSNFGTTFTIKENQPEDKSTLGLNAKLLMDGLLDL
jgi:hypothetical protein